MRSAAGCWPLPVHTARDLRAATHAHERAAAAVTVIGVITAIILFTSELREQLTPYVVQQVRCGPPPLVFQAVCLLLKPLTCVEAQMSVDVSRQQFTRVNFNITFPSLPCHGARLPWGGCQRSRSLCVGACSWRPAACEQRPLIGCLRAPRLRLLVTGRPPKSSVCVPAGRSGAACGSGRARPPAFACTPAFQALRGGAVPACPP